MKLVFRLSIVFLLCCIFSLSITKKHRNELCGDQKPLDIPCNYNRYGSVKDGRVDCCNDENRLICFNYCNSLSHVLVGRRSNECYLNGTWRYPFPECLREVHCPSRNKIQNRKKVNNIKINKLTKCTKKGCFTICPPGYRLYGKYKQNCNWLLEHHTGYAYYPKCIPHYLNTLCTMAQHKYCLVSSNTTCQKETEVPICTQMSGKSGPFCQCTDVGVRGICSNYDRVLCKGKEIDCFPGENGYTEHKTCGLEKDENDGSTCGCQTKKELPCKELYRSDPDRYCSIPVSGYGIHCLFTCGPGERLHDPSQQNGHRLCYPTGTWDYPLDVQCLKE